MGVTIRCKKAGKDMDMGGGGFNRLRNQVAKLVGEPFASHYLKLDNTFHLYGDERIYCVEVKSQNEEEK